MIQNRTHQKVVVVEEEEEEEDKSFILSLHVTQSPTRPHYRDIKPLNKRTISIKKDSFDNISTVDLEEGFISPADQTLFKAKNHSRHTIYLYFVMLILTIVVLIPSIIVMYPGFAYAICCWVELCFSGMIFGAGCFLLVNFTWKIWKLKFDNNIFLNTKWSKFEEILKDYQVSAIYKAGKGKENGNYIMTLKFFGGTILFSLGKYGINNSLGAFDSLIYGLNDEENLLKLCLKFILFGVSCGFCWFTERVSSYNNHY